MKLWSTLKRALPTVTWIYVQANSDQGFYSNSLYASCLPPETLIPLNISEFPLDVDFTKPPLRMFGWLIRMLLISGRRFLSIPEQLPNKHSPHPSPISLTQFFACVMQMCLGSTPYQGRAQRRPTEMIDGTTLMSQPRHWNVIEMLRNFGLPREAGSEYGI